LPPGEARRLHHEPARVRGAEGRMRADGNPNHPERARLHTMPNRRSQDMNRQRYNGVQPGPRVQPQPTRPGRPAADMRTGAQPRTTVQPRVAAQPRPNGGRPARHDGNAP
jgi:hypothetical protein